jgi:hypothetical protein
MGTWMTAMKDNPVQSDGASSAPVVPPAPAPQPPEPPKPPITAEVKSEAPPVKPEPPAEADDAKWPRTSADWKKFKAAREEEKTTYETKLKDYEAQVTALKGQKPVVPTDYEAVKKQAEEYSGIISQISVENHPKFKAYYDGAVTNQIELAKQIVGTDNAKTVEEVLALPDGSLREERISELFGVLTPLQQSRLGGIVNQISNIQAERSNEIKKSKDTFAAMQKQKENEAGAKIEGFKTMFDAESKKLQADHPAFQKRQGDDAWNAEVDQRIEQTKNYLFGNNMKPEQIVRAAADAVALPAILKQAQAQLLEIETLKKQVAELSSASPRIASDKSSEAAPAANGERTHTKAPAGSRPMDLLAAEWMKNLPAIGR